MNTPQPTTKTRARLTLLAVSAVFLMPLLLAWIFAKGPIDWRPQSNLNYGVLLQPPLQLNAYGILDVNGAALTLNSSARDWFVVVLQDGACSETCQQLIQAAERIQLAVGRDAQRVNLALLSREESSATWGEQNWWLPADNELVRELRLASGDSQFDTNLLIVDYLGHAILMYPPSEEGYGLLEDLKRLLRAAAT